MRGFARIASMPWRSAPSANSLTLSSSIRVIGLPNVGSGQDPVGGFVEGFHDMIGTIRRLFHGIAEVDEHGPASRSCPRLDIAAAIPYHKAGGEIDPQFAGGCEKHAGLRLAAGATLLLRVETSFNGVDRQGLGEASMHLLDDLPMDAPRAHVRLVGNDDEREPSLLQPVQAPRSLRIKPILVEIQGREAAAGAEGGNHQHAVPIEKDRLAEIAA